MATVTWGLLEKSLVDDETIEEAIGRLIGVHNDDEESHLLAGQSLQSHKASAIIDHAALSVVEDKLAEGCVTTNKITANQIIGKDFRTAVDVGAGVDGVAIKPTGIEMWQSAEKRVDIPISGNPYFDGDLVVGSLRTKKFIINTTFESLDAWTTRLTGGRGSVSLIGLGFCKLQCGNQQYDAAGIHMASPSMTTTFLTDLPILDVTMAVVNYSDADFRISMGTDYVDTYAEDVGFEYDCVNNLLFAFRCHSSIMSYYGIGGYTAAGVHNYRIEVFTDHIDWYVDGVLKLTRTTSLPSGSRALSVSVAIKDKHTASPYGYVSELIYIQKKNVSY